jgi:hypothetical protein
MSELPSLMRDQRKIDADHLKLLAIFHFVLAGFSLLGLGFLFLHWLVLHTIVFNPEVLKNAKGGLPPATFFAVFQWLYLVMGTVIFTMGLGNLISGWCLLKRRARIFSLVMAGINCVGFPFGTTLGIFTFIVLLRESVTEVFNLQKSRSTLEKIEGISR